MKRKKLEDRVNQILWQDWNPIGIKEDEAADEYKNYVSSIVKLLEENASIKKISKSLFHHANVNMGLSTKLDDHIKIATKLNFVINIQNIGCYFLMKYLNEKELEWSSVVANNAMNRERKAIGVNSYEKEIKLNPIDFILNRKEQKEIRWADLCCGRGNALIQTAQHFKGHFLNKKIKILGIDLVNFFSPYHEELAQLEFREMNVRDWQPEEKYDLITIIHGLHYIGDKIELILKTAATLKPDGIFIGSLDLKNIKIAGVKNEEKWLKGFFKEYQINYNSRTKLLKIKGQKNISNPLQFLGADDKAGPNYTGQPVVNSF